MYLTRRLSKKLTSCTVRVKKITHEGVKPCRVKVFRIPLQRSVLSNQSVLVKQRVKVKFQKRTQKIRDSKPRPTNPSGTPPKPKSDGPMGRGPTGLENTALNMQGDNSDFMTTWTMGGNLFNSTKHQFLSSLNLVPVNAGPMVVIHNDVKDEPIEMPSYNGYCTFL